MKKHTFELGFFYALLIVVFALLFFVFKPFIVPLFLALVFATVFYPLQIWLTKICRDRKTLSALVSTILLVLIIVLPLIIILLLVTKEAIDVFATMSANGTNSLGKLLSSINLIIDKILPASVTFQISIHDVQVSLRGIGNVLAKNANTLFSSAFGIVLSAFIFIISLFYFFKEGEGLVKRVINWSPLSDTYDETIVHKISRAFNSVIRGNLITACIQGLLAGLGFFISGIGAPLLLGFAVVIASLIPSVGTAIIMIPTVLFLFATGSISAGIFLLVWAVLVVGLVDNLLKPILMEKGISVHPFLILLSVLGGIAFFGPIGLIAGPVLVAIASALLELYPLLRKKSD